MPALSSLTKRLSSALATPRSRKLLALLVATLVTFGYVGPWVMHHNQTVKVTSGCLRLRLRDLDAELSQADAVLFQADRAEAQVDRILPFVGNGHVGLVAGEGQRPGSLLLRADEAWLGVNLYRPLVTAKVASLQPQSASVLHYRRAQVRRHQCYAVDEACVYVESRVLAHRFRPSLLLQEIVVENNAGRPVTLELSRPGPVKWKGSTTTTELLRVDGRTREYVLTAGDMGLRGPDHKVLTLVIAALTFAKRTQVPAHSVRRVQILTLVKFSEPLPAADPQVTAALVDEASDELFRLLPLDFARLVAEHEDAWSRHIWNTGLVQEPLGSGQAGLDPGRSTADVQRRLAHLSAVHSFNALTTAVVYYLMTSVQAPLLMASVPLKRKKEVIGALQRPGSCFNGRPTLSEESLWRPVQTEPEMSDLLSHWQHVLYKHGCHGLLSVGVTGLMQALMLSLLAGQFTPRELAFHADPLRLRTKVHLHNIFYNASFLHVDVDPGPGHQLLISITSVEAAGSEPVQLYACGTGCQSEPLLLTSSMQAIPLKWTVPQTPFLYISHDRRHLQYLRTKIIHYSHLYDLDDKDVNALMPSLPEDDKAEHGFHLPVAVWVVVIALILIFHVFLLNLIYREYCAGGSGLGIPVRTNTA